MADEDLNSSDIEVDAVASRWAGAALGKRSIEQMLEHATEDRISSKKVSKTLPLTMSSPHLEYHCVLWHTRLSVFHRDTLKITE
jgi:hypothetical protein